MERKRHAEKQRYKKEKEFREVVRDQIDHGTTNVVEDKASLLDRFYVHGKTIVQKDDVRNAFCDIRCRCNRNANVCRLKRWRIIDTVPHHCDNMSTRLERSHDADLMHRQNTREDGNVRCEL